jgi:hypothetical protein
MKANDPLDDLIAKLPVPPPGEGARERALHRATIALQQNTGLPVTPAAGWFSRPWKGAITGALALMAVVAGIALWRSEKPGSAQKAVAWTMKTDRLMLGQIEALFGPQLNAVVLQAGAAPDIRLSDNPDSAMGHAQPLMIELMRGAEIIRVLGYSGRTVCLQLAGQKVCIEPLATGDGNVILAGDHFCWTPQDRGGQVDGYHLSAKLLPQS